MAYMVSLLKSAAKGWKGKHVAVSFSRLCIYFCAGSAHAITLRLWRGNGSLHMRITWWSERERERVIIVSLVHAPISTCGVYTYICMFVLRRPQTRKASAFDGGCRRLRRALCLSCVLHNAPGCTLRLENFGSRRNNIIHTCDKRDVEAGAASVFLFRLGM